MIRAAQCALFLVPLQFSLRYLWIATRGGVMEKWKFWDWLAYIILSVAALILALDTGIRQSEKLFESSKTFLSSPFWGFAPLALMAIASLIFILKSIIHFPEYNNVILHTTSPTISQLKPGQTETFLRLKFRGGQIEPLEVKAVNILQWYVVWSGNAIYEIRDKKNIVKDTIQFPRTWVVYLLFDAPILMRQLIVEPSMPSFPRYEIQIATSNFAIITTFGDDPPIGLLDISAKF